MQARLTRLWQRRGVQMATAIGLGVALALGQAPYGLCPLALAGLTGLTFLISRADGPGQAARLAWAGGAGHF
ncbi:hypothetical protein CKO19_15480, partial [Rhodovulum adriaticum]|nr:hypothetical protein [Rhodovulum adriaticum]